MATVTAISETRALEDKIAIYRDSVIEGLPNTHDEASPSVKLMWDGREWSNFTRDTIYVPMRYQRALGGGMTRTHIFTQESQEDIVEAKFTAKRMETHESTTWFDMQERLSDDALYDHVELKITMCWETLWLNLAYMLFSKQDETSAVDNGVVDFDTVYTTLLPGGSYKLPSGALTDLFDGFDMAIRGNKEAHTYGGLDITANSTINNFWQAYCDNASDAGTDTNDDGTPREITATLLDLLHNESNVGGGANSFAPCAGQLFTGIQKPVQAQRVFQADDAPVTNALGVEGSIKYRGTEYYVDPFMKDVHYSSDYGGTIFYWDPKRFCLHLHESSKNPIVFTQVQGQTGGGFEHIPASTVFLFAVGLWGNFISKQRRRLARGNNFKY